MAEAKTKPTRVSVKDFVAAVPNETRRKDAQSLLKLFEKVTGWKPQMWGPTIIGFGSYDYVYESGTKGSMCVVGFSPRATGLVIYSGLMASGDKAAPLLAKLGKYKTGKGCLYINKLEDVDLGQFEKLIKAGVANQKNKIAENGWTMSAT
ncbi:MAG: DUF1801 domain-containing protein [Alphaproteobacteria bacterium]